MARVTNYLPIAHATHDDEGNVVKVEIDWTESMEAVEQRVDEETANELSKHFDDWLNRQPQSNRAAHWEWAS